MGCEGELAKALSLSILSALFVLTAGGTGGNAARAEDKCLPAPTGKVPPGSHWHYRTDPATQTKCWYLRPADSAQPAASGDGADTAAAPAAPAKPAKPHQAARAAGAGKPATAGAAATPTSPANPQQGAQANGPPASPATQAPWPDPQPQGATDSVAWPAPPAVMPSAAGANPAPDAATTNAAPEPTAGGQETGSINAPAAGDAPAPEASPPPPAQTSDVSGSTILALAAAMAVAGVLMRWLLGKMFARRRKLAAERREPVWVTDEYVMPDALTRGTRRPPGRVDHERLDDEVKQALRKLLRTLERSAA
jgi:hypothetical protein